MKARLNDAAERLTVHINPCLAPGICMAELCGCCPTKGVTKYSHARHVEPSRESSGLVGPVQELQPIDDESKVGGPPIEHSVHTTALLGLRQERAELRVILRRPSHRPAVRENDEAGAIGSIEAHND